MTNAYFIQKLSKRVDQLENSLERTYDQIDRLEYDLERTNKQLFELTEKHDKLTERHDIMIQLLMRMRRRNS